MFILSIIFGIGSLVCWILTLIKMFQNEKQIILAILGIICPLWAFIWGWMNASKLGHKNIMIIWTACIVLGNIFSIAGGGFSASFSTGN